MTTAIAPSPLYTLPAADPASGRPAVLPLPDEADVHRLAYGRLTLDELVSGAWAALGAGAPAACPVCDSPMHRATPAGPARCSNVACGAILS
jgi:hypothetical protein